MNVNPLYHHTPERLNEEKVWIQRAQKSPEHFGPLYKKYHEAIFRFVYQRMDDKEQAYDVTAQIFVKAMHNIHRFEDRGVPFASWLYRIAKSEVYQCFRDRKADRYVNIDTVQIVEFIDEFDHEENLNNVNRVTRLLKELKEKEMQLIEMRFFEKRSFREIAEILQMTENNAKVKTFRVVEKLKKLFEQKI
jgi:RNA polymerase sigma-70 factor (ECF subfamily)